MQNNDFIFERLSNFLSYIFEVNNFITLLFCGCIAFIVISNGWKLINNIKHNNKFTQNKIKLKNQNNNINSTYFDYAPIDLIDEYKSQEESNNIDDDISTPYAEQFKELKSFLENDNVKNIAVFGSFGAGKSSFVKTFFDHFTINNKRYEDDVIYISLPDFDYRNGSKNSKQSHKEHGSFDNKTYLKNNKQTKTTENQSDYSKKNILEEPQNGQAETSESDLCKLDLETVETEIIRQLVCSKISKKIPVSLFSNFKTDLLEKVKISFVIFCCITFFLLSLNQQVGLKEFFNKDIYLLPKLFLLFLLLHSLINYNFKRFRFSNVSFFNIGVSAKDKSELSVFDAYLDEITYLFEKSKCRYVVFEDLDRTENYEVLTHLRSLNFILNNDHRCKDKISGEQKRIVFIYVLRSDIFNNAKETVKFFDASVHVQKVITKANSWEFFVKYRNDLRERFKDNKLKSEFLSKENLDNDFLSDIALFITDIRLIKMIFNDYLNILGVLEVVLSKIENIKVKLFSLKIFSYAAFRTFYPNEYENLLKGRGIIFYRLNNKNEYWEKIEEFFSNSKNNRNITESALKVILTKSETNSKLEHTLSNYMLNKPLLRYLIDNNYLSEDYRFYGALFAKDTFQKETYDLDFFSEIINFSDKYNPELKISNYIINVILQYFPNMPFFCKSFYNFDFFYSILHRSIIIDDTECKNTLENHTTYFLVEFAYFSCNKGDKKEFYKQEVILIYSFIVDLCDFIRQRQSSDSEPFSKEICLWIFTILSKLAKLADSKLIDESFFREIVFGKFFAYTLNYYELYSKNEEAFFKYKIFNKEKIRDLLLSLLSFANEQNESLFIQQTQDAVLNFVANDKYFITSNFFQALKDLNIQFQNLPHNLSVDVDNHFAFIKELINEYSTDKDNNIHFYFKENGRNFNQISKYLSDKFLQRQNYYHIYDCVNNEYPHVKKNRSTSKLNFLTILFNSTSEHTRSFDAAFFRFLFVTEHYENLLNAIDFSLNKTRCPYLCDNDEIV